MNIRISRVREAYQIIRQADKLEDSPGYDLNGKEIKNEEIIGRKIKDVYDDGDIFLILE